MKNDIIKFNNLILVLIFILLYLSLIIGFYFNEDSTGGAFLDYRGQKVVSEAFAINFKNTFLNYDSFATRHSPLLIIFLSFFEKINLSDNLIRIIHLHILLVLPFIFYLILIEKFKYIEKKYLLLIVGLIFLSPTFRTLSIWPDSRLLGLSIFSLSILSYLFFLRSNQLKYCFFNIVLCAISAYISPNFSVFSIYFFYFFCKKYSYFSRELIYIILTNILLSLPALYYLFILDVNFLTKTAVITEKKNFIFFNNVANQILMISSIIFFYFLPFVLTNILNLNFKNITSKIIISLLIFIICLIYFDYKFSYTGGGIFFKTSYYLFENNYLFYLISYISLLFLCLILSNKFENYLIFLLILLSNPQISIYHKYYDPFLIVILFSLVNIDINIKKIMKFKTNVFIYLYFTMFLIIGFLK